MMKKTALLVLLFTVAVLFKVEVVKAESGGSLIDKGFLDTSLTVDYGKRSMKLDSGKSNVGGVQNTYSKSDISDVNAFKPSLTDTIYSAKLTYGIADYLNLFVNVGTIFE